MEALDRINGALSIPKYVQVANAVVSDINDGLLNPGERVPSINEMSETYYLSRVTIERAYKELTRRGVIKSVKGKGFFITNCANQKKVHVLLLFNKLSVYKKTIYYSILNALGENAVVDLQIFHFNGKVCEKMIEEGRDKYNYYVIMPHFNQYSESALQAIKTIPEDKLILLDKGLDGYRGDCGTVYQDFAGDIKNALGLAKDSLQKYKEITLVYPKDVPYPADIVKGFRFFCQENSVNYRIIDSTEKEVISMHSSYIVLEESDLVNLIKQGRAQGLKLGADYGIISYNDTPLKEILADGITVISTEHEKMGETAAYMMKHKLKEKIRNPFVFIKRNSF